MPMQMLRASKGHATAHVAGNLSLWIGISAAATLLTGLLMYYFEMGTSHSEGKSHWGDAMAFFGMVLGSLVMIKSQEGFVSSHVVPDDNEGKVATTPTPCASLSAAV